MARVFLIILSFLHLCTLNAQINESFTDGDYIANPIWVVSASTDFSVNAGQLKSANTTSNTSFYISTSNTLTSNCTWEFWVNIQFATSGANYVDAYLISDNSNLLAPNINGYFVRIGNTSDDICLYKSSVGTQTILIDGINSSVASSSNNLIKIKVTRTSANLFTLERDMTGTGSSYVSEGNITDASFSTSTSFGFVVKQSTAGFFGKHFFDDIAVSTIVVDVTPPSILSNTVISSNQLDVLFDEPVEITSAQTTANYSVNNSIGSPTLATRDASNLALVHLSFSNTFVNALSNTLTVSGVQDVSLNAITSATTSFTYTAPITIGYRDIIINEIYADPSPLVNLTAAEFIELYNNSSNTFNLNGLKLTDGTSIATLGNYTLAPNSYVIICPIADTAQFNSLGYNNRLGVGSFPSLNNTGDNVYLKTSTGIYIDSVNYSDSWYQDAVKKSGGWTLEQINPNPNVNCAQSTNWIASNDTDGGTPGFINSVYSIAPDVTAPSISSISIINGHQISVCFSEIISNSQLSTNANYSISGGIGSPSLAISSSANMCTTLALSSNLVNATTYTLTISNVTDCSGNALSPNTIAFTYTADVIPPSIVSNTVISNTQLDVLFNEPLEINSAQTIVNYSVNNSIGNPTNALRDVSNTSLVHLTFATPFTNLILNTLNVTGVKDTSLNAITTVTTSFTYYLFSTALYKDIIINEIFADPSPVINLPTCDFIELYNSSTKTINLSGLKVADTYTGSGATLGYYVLAPNSYVIICPQTDTAQFTALGYMNKLGVAAFPSLNNAGDNIYFKNSSGGIIDSVNYLDTWYKDIVKKAGGYSLELINPTANLNCSEISNWIASNDTDGGTPGFINSVYSTAPDITPPAIDTVIILDALHIQVCFDDVISTSQLNTNSNYTISGGIGTPSLSIVMSNHMCVTLSLTNAMINATTYSITISGITDCNGNNLLPNVMAFTYTADVVPPSIISNNVLSNTQLDVLFSEPLELTSAQTTTNYIANNSIGNPSNATRDAANKALIHLTFGTAFSNGLANMLSVSNVKDTLLNTISTATTGFTYYAYSTAAYKDIIINEIYADPSPIINLTSCEFIELYNRNSTQTYNLSGLHVTDSYSATTGLIGNYALQPNSYVIICPIADTAQFTTLGYMNKIGVSSFPSLNNSNDNLYLKTSSSVMIDSVNYFDSWYQDVTKKAGGYTLELINPNINSSCSQFSNWIGSNDADGGTPGFVNSVYSLVPDITGPKISSVNVIDSVHISVCFDDVISSSQLNTIGNYVISNSIGSPTSVVAVNGNSCVTISLSNKLVNATNYSITVNSITDCNGNAINPNTSTFSYYKHKAYDVVINELMPDPDPSINLPPEEYVELKNRTHFNINLKGWSFSTPTSTKKLPDITIKPDSFVVLTGVGNSTTFNSYGIVTYEVANFPSLANAGTTLTLRDSNGVMINAITYATSWYNDNNKTDGGWSLEQIDANNPCAGQSNWHVSTNVNGGTPGKRNSVLATNSDNNAPQLDRVSVISPDTIILLFTEPLDSITSANSLNYTFDNGLTAPTYVKAITPDFKKAILKLSSPMQLGTTYNCTVLSGVTDCVGNPLINGSLPFALPQAPEPNDVVINEVLFDPSTGGVDFVELYNRSSKTINLKDLRIGSMDTITNLLKDTEIMTDDGYLLFPESYVVISENSSAIKQQYLTSNPKGFLDVVNLPSMNTSDDVVTLSGANTLVIDNFKYTSKMHFPLLTSTKGVSLERIDFNRPTNDRTNWNSAAEAVGFATPAYRNSQYLQADGGSGVTIPNPLFSPDNDGYNDVLNISYKLDEPGKAANVYIYDSKGRQVRYLIRNEQLTQDGTLSWNGINDDNEKAPIGIYVVYVELFNLSGKVNKYKLSCTLAGKL